MEQMMIRYIQLSRILVLSIFYVRAAKALDIDIDKIMAGSYRITFIFNYIL